MTSLLVALDRDPTRRLVIAAAIVVVALAGLAFARHGRGDDACQSAAAELAPTWNPIRVLAVHAAFGTTGLPYAESAWTSFHRGVARYADNWIALHREACVATRVRETQSTQVLDRRMACLDERRHELDALLRTYEHPAPAMLERAGELANHLSPLASCSDLEALAPVSNPELRNRLAELRASYSPTQLAEVRSIRDRARMLGDTALLASALELEGNLVAVAGDARAAEPILYRALESAELARADEIRAHTWISLVRVIGRDQAKLAEAKTFANLARSVATRLGAHVELTAALGFALVPVLTQAGDLDAAEREATSLVAPLSPLDPDRGVALGYLANVQRARGNFADAIRNYTLAYDATVAALGPDHPSVAAAFDNRGLAAYYAGDYRKALADHQQAMALRTRILGPDHPDIAVSLANAANAEVALGDTAAAAPMYEHAIQVFEKARGPDHPSLATFHMNLGSAYAELHRGAAAHDQYRLALEIQKRTLGEAHGDVGLTLVADAEVLLDEHRATEALDEARRGAAIIEAAVGSDHPDVATALVIVGRAELATNLDAVVTLQRALAIDDRAHVAPEQRGDVERWLARAIKVRPRGDRRRRRSSSDRARRRRLRECSTGSRASRHVNVVRWTSQAGGASGVDTSIVGAASRVLSLLLPHAPPRRNATTPRDRIGRA